MFSNLYLKDNYLNKQIQVINNCKITEYDLKSAGMNILYSCGILLVWMAFFLTLNLTEISSTGMYQMLKI